MTTPLESMSRTSATMESATAGASPSTAMDHLSLCASTRSAAVTKLLWKVWEERECLKLDGINNLLRGYSWAALRTNFNVGRLMFDAGLSANILADYIFLTHGHSDHSASLYFHTLSENQKVIFVPAAIADTTRLLLQTTYALSNFGVPFDPELATWKVVPVAAGDELDIIHNGKRHQVKVYGNDHSVPCVSFGIKEEKKKVKAEYQSYIDQNRGRELGALRRQGVEVEEISFVPRFVYIGDTTEQVFELNPDLFSYKDIIVECTFLLEDDLEQASHTKHCHWKTLRPHIQAHPECRFILYHFSQRYKPAEIEDFFRSGGPNFEPNVLAWTHS